MKVITIKVKSKCLTKSITFFLMDGNVKIINVQLLQLFLFITQGAG